MKKTADVKIKIDEITMKDYHIRATVVKSLLEEDYEVTITPEKDFEGRIKSEKLTIYRIEKIEVDEKRRY